MRCFIAVDVPPAVREAARRAQESLRAAGADVKWTSPESLHVTLKFLGWLEPPAVEQVKRRLAADVPSRERLAVRFRGIGTFPERGQPRVIWAGCEGDVEGLSALARLAEEAGTEAGVAPETRPFAPHLTLGRVKSPRNGKALQALLPRFRDTDFGECPVQAVVLYKSTLRPQGALYEPQAAYPLRQARGPAR